MRHAGRGQTRYQAPQGVARQGVDVVEVCDTVGGHAIALSGELQLRHESPYRPRQGHHDHSADASGYRIAGEDQHWSVAGVAANQISPRFIDPIRPVLGRAPIGDGGQAALPIRERLRMPGGDVPFNRQPRQVAPEGFAEQL